MKPKCLLLLFLFGLFILCSCSGTSERSQYSSRSVTSNESQHSSSNKPKFDNFYAHYPRYRIDHLMGKIGIFGNNVSKEDIPAILTRYFYSQTDVKVIEPGNLESILHGKIIEYDTGLNQEDAQKLSQLLQIDHIVLYDEEISPHDFYKYGGRFYVRIKLKIVNTINGEVIFVTSKEFGAKIEKGMKPHPQAPQHFIYKCAKICFGMVGFELIYALGGARSGVLPKRGTTEFVIDRVMIDSPAHGAGIEKGDKIVEINGIKINDIKDASRARHRIKQGDTAIFKIERNGKIIDFEIKYPLIPIYPTKQEKKLHRKNKSIDL